MSNSRIVSRRKILAAGAALPISAGLAATNGQHALAAAYPTFNIRTDFGAAGNGTTNDTAAFQRAAAAIIAAGGGTLNIPAGVYIVGQQRHVAGSYPYYQMQPIFHIPESADVQFLAIKGVTGAVLRLAPGLRFGSFHKDTGAVYNPPSLPFTDPAYGVEAGRMIEVLSGSNITIENLELDGSNTRLVLGGEFGDTGRQLKATGIRLLRCTNVAITNVYSHHHGLDGITIGWGGLTVSDPATPHTLTSVRSEYNGRQGLSWTGGRGLTCVDCSFNHTGRAAVFSKPGAGVDIEAEGSVCRDGYFQNCEFINNAGNGLDVTYGDSGYSRFEYCTFWGTTRYSAYTTKPGLVFKWSQFYGETNIGYGSADATLATRYGDCTFEDKPWTNGQVYRDTYLVADKGSTGQNVSFADCTFIAHQVRSVWTNDLTVTKKFLRCTFNHQHSGLADLGLQAHLWGCSIIGCTFTESMGSTTKKWYINVNDVQVSTSPEGDPTQVTGPAVRWASPTGRIGVIPDGSYG